MCSWLSRIVLALQRRMSFMLLLLSPKSCSSEPHVDITLGPASDELHISSVPDHAVTARVQRMLLVVCAVRAASDSPASCHAGAIQQYQARPQ